MTGPFTVRLASPEDAAAIAQLNGIVQGLHYEAHPNRFRPPDAAVVMPVFQQWLGGERPDTRGWICLDDVGEPVGYVVAVYRERPESPFTTATRWVELDQIAVRDDRRGRGAARQLALAVADWATSLGVDSLELSVWQFNTTAQAFFSGLGFEPLQQRHVWRLPPTNQ